MDAAPSWDWHAAADYGAPPNPQSAPAAAEHTGPANPPPPAAESRRRRYGPRSCRICLDTEQPKYPENTTTTFGIASASSRPEYVSDDPEMGRLLSPCKCKGSQKYVHEGCLTAWRTANPTAARNYWKCPTCGFTYQMARLHYASALSSTAAQVLLTLFILLMSIFLLGFMADPILDLWFDPVGTISDTVTNVITDIEAMEQPIPLAPTTWSEHFVKGFFSLGLVGFLKSMLVMSPWQWWNLRSSGILGTRQRHGTGRARTENMSLALVIIGALTFLMGTWKVVKSLSARVLKRVSDRVIDVGVDDDDDFEAENQEDKKDE